MTLSVAKDPPSGTSVKHRQSKRFSGLDGLRFISISFVILHHLFTYMDGYGISSDAHGWLGTVGLYGIHFFFMGSGFLITYLLYWEQNKNGRIDLRFFFARRILRIWPAYYVLIAIVLLILINFRFFDLPGITTEYLQNSPIKSNLFFYFFLPHLQSFAYPTAPLIHHTYTIGIEEQFYILWGLGFVFFRNKWPSFLIGILLIYPLLALLHHHLHSHPEMGFSWAKSGITYLQYSRFSTFAIGSLLGIAFYKNKPWIGYFRKIWVQVLVYLVLVVSMATNVQIPFLQNEWMAVVSGLVLLAATGGQKSVINYDAGWLRYLGNISYGIYLFHMIAIVLACRLVQALGGWIPAAVQVSAVIAITFVLSIAFGWLSYRLIELPFLKLKNRFRKVQIRHL